jgi:glycosyltransferase involved in cell wall biosynthesis
VAGRRGAGADTVPVTTQSISAVLPAHNEEAVIGRTVERTVAALAAQRLRDFEVIVVDDGSSDATAAIVERLMDSMPEVRLIRHPVNRGYGGALRSGFDAARCEAVFFMDSDGQFDPADIRRLLDVYAPHRVAFGYRARRSDPWIRRANHWAFFSLVGFLFGPTTRDVNCAFKLFPRHLGVDLSAEGAVIGTELVLRARHQGYDIGEVAIPHYPRLTGSATGANLRVVLRAFRELFRLRRRGLGELPAGRVAATPIGVDAGEVETTLARSA